jgi:GDP-L-fucose synthase
MRILILGGHGFMGKNLNKTFKESDYEIINESRKTGCDLTDFNSIKSKLLEINPDIIIHSAAHVGSISYVSKNCAEVVHDNSLMYINLYKAINETNPKILVINPISNCSYPGIINIQNEENWWDGIIHDSVESYGNPKKLGYIISECYRKQYGIKTLNLIIPNAYGPEDYLDENRTHALNGLVMRMIKSQKNDDEQFVVWGSGTPLREWIYMPDVARIIKKIIDDKLFELPNPLNLGQEYGVSINESVEEIRKLLNYDVKITHDLTKQDGAPIKVLGKTKFDSFFPNFNFTSYDEGISNTINYYKNKI